MAIHPLKAYHLPRTTPIPVESPLGFQFINLSSLQLLADRHPMTTSIINGSCGLAVLHFQGGLY